MPRILVTGANGLIGSNLCHKLGELGYEVTAMVREGSNLLGLEGFEGRIVRGDILQKILNGRRITPYVPGGMCVVGVDDVVDGQIAALEFGVTGARYILGGENLTFKELFGQIAEVVGASPPSIRVPLWSARWAAAILEMLSSLTGRPPVLTKAHVVSATLPHYFSIERAKRELGYKPRPVIDAIRKSYEWYLRNNLI
ncbi:MAG: NAD-dependent epimerase/dehydratase family protein [Bacteroidetes bacterium]|nr:NAD-dependent epimerase/dehydratase family protein [Bacteroidota bacterium]